MFLFDNEKGDYLRFGYSYLRDQYDGFLVRSRFQLFSFLVASFKTRQTSNKTLDTEYGLEYLAECWSVSFLLQDKSRQSGADSELEFSVLFNLAGLGNSGKI